MCPAYFDTGFSVRKPMWHGGGLILDEFPTDWADARQKAGLTWEPERVGNFYPAPIEAFEPLNCYACQHRIGTAHHETCDFVSSERVVGVRSIESISDDAQLTEGGLLLLPATESAMIARNDTWAELGPVGDGFSLIYHGGKERPSMENIIDAFIDEGVVFETAGAARGGRDVWALMRLDEPYKVAGDTSDTIPFFALLNSHNGSGACKLVKTQVRVVCWNTYQAASMEGERTGEQLIFRHTAGVAERIEEAKQGISQVRADAGEWMQMAEELFGMPADEVAFNHFLSEFIPHPPKGVVSERVQANVDKAQAMFKSLYLDSVTTEAHRGTALGLVDAATEYLDHLRGYRNSETYMGRTLLKAERLKTSAYSLARRVCTN